jgi:hypothetical protein
MPSETTNYDLPYPLSSDSVNVHEDIQNLAEAIDAVLPDLGLPYLTLEVSNTSGVTITKGDPVYIIGHGATKPRVAKSNASTLSTFPVVGLAEATITNTSDGVVVLTGVFNGVNTSSYTAGDRLYVAEGGGLTATQPTTGGGVIGVVAKSAVSGTIIVGASKGNGTWGSMKAGLS